MANLTSTLTLKAVDDISGPMKKAAEQLKSFALSAKDLDKAVKLDALRQSQVSFREAANTYKATQQSVRALAQEYAAADSPTKRMTDAMQRARQEASRAGQAFEQQSAAFRQARVSMEALGVPISQVANEEQRLRTVTQEATVAMEQQARRAQTIGARIRSGFGGAMGGAGAMGMMAMFAGPGILRATGGAVKAGAQFQHETDFAFPAAGIGKKDTAWASKQAYALASKYPILTPAENMELYRETYSVISGEVKGREGLTDKQRVGIAAEDTQKIFPYIAKAQAALKASGSGNPGDLQKLVKGLESLGITQHLDQTKDVINGFVKATQVAGNTLNVDTMLKAMQQMHGTGMLLNTDSIKHMLVTMIQEAGSRVGAGIGAMTMQFLGETGHKQALEWKKLGFLKESDLIRTKTGAIQGVKPGHRLMGADLAESSPETFIWKVLKPALVRAGYVTLKQQVAETMLLFGRQRARRVAAALVSQKDTYEQANAKYDLASGVDAADKTKHSAIKSLVELTNSFVTLGTALTSPLMAHAATAMDAIAHSLTSFADGWSKFSDKEKSPITAELLGGAAVGYGAYKGGKLSLGLLGKIFGGGTALKTSAVALDGSAAALTRAAAALGGSSVLNDLPGGTKAGKTSIWSKAKGLGAAALPIAAAYALPAAAFVATASLSGDTPESQKGMMAKRVEDETKDWRKNRDFTLGSNRTFGFGSPSSFQPPPRASFNFRDVDVKEADAATAGHAVAAAFQRGLVTGLNAAVSDTSDAVSKIIAMLAFSASPNITPSAPAGATAAGGASGSWTNGLHADYGITP